MSSVCNLYDKNLTHSVVSIPADTHYLGRIAKLEDYSICPTRTPSGGGTGVALAIDNNLTFTTVNIGVGTVQGHGDALNNKAYFAREVSYSAGNMFYTVDNDLTVGSMQISWSMATIYVGIIATDANLFVGGGRGTGGNRLTILDKDETEVVDIANAIKRQIEGGTCQTEQYVYFGPGYNPDGRTYQSLITCVDKDDFTYQDISGLHSGNTAPVTAQSFAGYGVMGGSYDEGQMPFSIDDELVKAWLPDINGHHYESAMPIIGNKLLFAGGRNSKVSKSDVVEAYQYT